MDNKSTVTQLKKLLLKDVAYLCRLKEGSWNEPIARTIHDIQTVGGCAVIFGGTLRSLLLDRVQKSRIGRPRDLDIVVSGVTLDELRRALEPLIVRETRFGGLHLRRMDWSFDVWPLDQTWAFTTDSTLRPSLETLPHTTFLNLEAIAVEASPRAGHARQIFSADDCFFDGIRTRTIELNREENPYPSLCVVRAINLAAVTGFAIGPRLARFLASHGPAISSDELHEIQQSHFGRVFHAASTIGRWLDAIHRHLEGSGNGPIMLPTPRQLALWPLGELNTSAVIRSA